MQRNHPLNTIKGSTENTALLKFSLNQYATGTAITIVPDSARPVSYTVKNPNDSIYLARSNNNRRLSNAPAASQKNPARYGTFKEAFNNKMVFVYGATGNAEENDWSLNKTRYDAEAWYYRGNGAVDIIKDKDFPGEI